MTDIDAVYFCIYMNQTFYILQLNSILLSDYRHTNICVYTIKYIYMFTGSQVKKPFPGSETTFQ